MSAEEGFESEGVVGSWVLLLLVMLVLEGRERFVLELFVEVLLLLLLLLWF